MFAKQEKSKQLAQERVYASKWLNLKNSAHWHDELEIIYCQSGRCYISVEEQDKTLYVSNALTSQKRDDFDALKPGDKLFCYIEPDGAKNRVVEIKSDNMIISLEEYQNIHKRNGIGFIVIMSVLSVSAVVCAIVLLKSYKVKRV